MVRKKQLKKQIDDLTASFEQLQKEKLTLFEAGVIIQKRLDLIQNKQTVINTRYDQLLKYLKETLDYIDLARKEMAKVRSENDAFIGIFKNQGKRICILEDILKDRN